MKRLLLLILILPVLFLSCSKEEVDPIDIFVNEELTTPVGLKLGNDAGLDKLFVNSERIIETSSGYHIKGTIFSQSVSGIIPVTSGDFTFNTDPSSPSAKGFTGMDFKGYGTASFPSKGLFSISEIDEIPGSEVYYNTGKFFKEESKLTINHLPLIDDRYYFRYRLDKSGKGKEYRMKKITIMLKEYYLDGRDPAALFTGDIYSQSSTGIKKLIVVQGVAGISANELWNFEPYSFSQNLETIIGGTGFEKMNGGITLSGIIPIKKYPLKILGQAVINTSFSKNGPLDFFERGFEDASFRIGVNGQLFFTNELVTFLTGVDTVSLGKATLQADFSDDSFSMRMAGEYSNNILDRFLGDQMMKFIPVNSGTGIMYLRATEVPDDFIVYIEETISLQIPGLGVTPLSDCIFRVTKDEVGLSGSVSLPYNIGNVKVTGSLNADGSFLLKGIANSQVDLGSGLNYNASLDVEVSEKGVKLAGEMAFPYSIGNVNVTGGILSDELYFGGTIGSAIPFPVNASVNSNLQMVISTKTGISLSGGITIPGGIGTVQVKGAVNTEELLLTGTIGSGVKINFGNVDVSTGSSLALTASSKTGVVMTGSVNLPFSLGSASSTVRVTSGGLSMTCDLGSNINISGYPLFNADMSASATTAGGLWLSGQMKFPGNFGWVNVSGYVRNSGYSLTGSIGSSSIDFGIVKLSTSFSMSITNYAGIKTTASGRGCVNLLLGEVCETVDVDVYIDYYNNSLKLCMGFPGLGSACVGW